MNYSKEHKKNNQMKLDILAFGAHPDDVELGCGGTIAKEVAAGKKVGIIDLTRGELGSRGSVEIRNSESAKASEILGVVVRENLNMRDGFFVNDEKHQLLVIEMLRKYRPEIVLCNAIDDRHIDHTAGTTSAKNKEPSVPSATVSSTCSSPKPKTYWRMVRSLGKLNSSPMTNIKNTTPNSPRWRTSAAFLDRASACGPITTPTAR